MRGRMFLKYCLCAAAVLVSLVCLAVPGSGSGPAEAQGSWSPPVKIPDTYAPKFVDLAVDSQGTVHVVYTNSWIHHQSKPKDQPWSSRTNIGEDRWGLSPDIPFVHMDDADNLHVVWQEVYYPGQEGEIWYNVRSALLGAWQEADLLSGRDMSRCPAVATDRTGGVHMVGLLDASPDKLLYSVKPSGGSWVGPGEIPNVSSDMWPYLDIALDASDTLHVVFIKDGLSYINKPSGGAWSPRVTISSGNLYYAVPRIGIGPSGTLHVVWEDNELNRVRYASKPAGGSWTTPIDVPNASPVASLDMTLDAAENLHVVWIDPDAQQVYYTSRRHADGTWTARRTLTSAGPPLPDPGWPHIAVGPDGVLHAVWHDEGEIYYTHTGGGFQFHIYLPLVVRSP